MILGNQKSTLGGADIITENLVALTYAKLDNQGLLALHNGTEESQLKNTNVTNPGVILEFPDKATGSYTIATTDDVGGYLNNVVLVNSVSDLPAPSGGTITLAPNTVYEFNTGTFNIGTDYLTVSDGTIIEGQSSFNTSIVYTGTGSAITGTDVNFAARQIVISAPNARIITFTNLAKTKNISIQNCAFVNQASSSNIEGYNITFISQVRFISCNNGIVLTNNLGVALELVVFNSTNSGTYITLIPEATTTVKFQNCDLEINTGNNGIQVVSTTIASGIISGCDFKGTASVASRLSGVNGNTPGWNITYGANTGISGLQFVDIEITGGTVPLGNSAGTYAEGVKGYALSLASYDPLATVMEVRTTGLFTIAAGVTLQVGVYNSTNGVIVGGLGATSTGSLINTAVASNFIAVTPNLEYSGYYVKSTGAIDRKSIKLTLKIY